MKKLAIIYGTRPQVIKLAPLVKELEKHKDQLSYILINTGQHYSTNMNDIFHKQLGIGLPHYNTETARVVRKVTMADKDIPEDPATRLGKGVILVSEILTKEKPDMVAVIGDTDSTLMGALASKKLGIPLAHIEAGVRSGDRDQPEEINRILVDEMSDIHFMPNQSTFGAYMKSQSRAVFKPNDEPDNIIKGCDLQLDAFMMYKNQAKMPDSLTFPIEGFKYNLLTLHRASLTEEFISEVKRAVAFIGRVTYWPLHPRIAKQYPELVGHEGDSLYCIPPVDYFEMLWLVQNAQHILTDSGGLLREAMFSGKPCTNLRTRAEWLSVYLNEYTALDILNKYQQSISVSAGGWIDAHGNGEASKTIVSEIKKYLL